MTGLLRLVVRTGGLTLSKGGFSHFPQALYKLFHHFHFKFPRNYDLERDERGRVPNLSRGYIYFFWGGGGLRSVKREGTYPKPGIFIYYLEGGRGVQEV